MSLLGFKRQFAPFVEDGSKAHTIRAERALPIKVGETLHCYVDPRQRSMRLLGRWPCVKIQDIAIDHHPLSPDSVFIDIRIDGIPLSWDEKVLLARQDGFRSGDEDRLPDAALVTMVQFWKARLPFYGKLIHWDFARPLSK